MADWPRMPYLNDELREWIAAQLATLGVDEIALYAVDPQRGQDEERRVLVATEVGLIDGWYAPRGGSSARYGFTARLWPWQAVRGVDLRNETYRVWALEHRTRWWLRLARPAFEAETDAPELGAALCDLAKVCAVMAEPAGWQAAQEEVPARREPLRVVPTLTPPPPEAGTDVERVAPTGRPAVPPPMASKPAPAPEPQPLRGAAQAEAVADADRAEGQAMKDAAPPAASPTPVETEAPDGETAAAPQAGEAAGADEAATTAQPASDEPEGEAADTHQPSPAAATSAGTRGVSDVPRSAHRSIGMSLGAFRRPGPEAPASANGDAPLRDEEEVMNLGDVDSAEEPLDLDDYDPDPLGLRGPLHR